MSPAIISLIILVVCIVLFIARPIPNAATACLGCLLFALTGVCDFSAAFSGFSNSTVILMFGMMVVGIAMMDTGAANLVGQKVAKLSGHKEKLFILLAGLTSAVLSTFLSNTAVIAIFLPIIASIANSDKNMNRMNITLPVTLGAMFGGVCTLVGSTPQLTANGILSEMSGTEIGMFDYTLPGICITAVYILFVLTIGHKIGNKVWGNREAVEIKESETVVEEVKINKKKMIIMLVIFILTIISFIGAWIPTQTTAVIAALLCIITGCTTQKSVIKNMDWSVVFVLAGCLGLASGITKGGLGDMIGQALSGVVESGIPVVVLFAIFVIATMLVSNFITNSTAVVIMLPVALSLCLANQLNPIAFTLGIVFAANLTFSTPLANAQTAMTLVAGYKFSDYIKYTWLLDIPVILSILVFVPLFFPLTVS
ncbi:MAG: SLC13/DASS family transporter [Oscillospiraceae bacterium]|nr:SLC13/DASS family transporter [Oscillospiraceae bacterium]